MIPNEYTNIVSKYNTSRHYSENFDKLSDDWKFSRYLNQEHPFAIKPFEGQPKVSRKHGLEEVLNDQEGKLVDLTDSELIKNVVKERLDNDQLELLLSYIISSKPANIKSAKYKKTVKKHKELARINKILEGNDQKAMVTKWRQYVPKKYQESVQTQINVDPGNGYKALWAKIQGNVSSDLTQIFITKKGDNKVELNKAMLTDYAIRSLNGIKNKKEKAINVAEIYSAPRPKKKKTK